MQWQKLSLGNLLKSIYLNKANLVVTPIVWARHKIVHPDKIWCLSFQLHPAEIKYNPIVPS